MSSWSRGTTTSTSSDVLKEKGYDVKVAHPLMVKAIAYAKVKNDKVDARTLADLLRADMIPESYVPDEKTREVRDLVRRRHYLVETRTGFKNKVKAELATRWVKHEGDVFTQEGRKFLRSLHIDAVDDYLDTIEFLDGKIGELDVKVKENRRSRTGTRSSSSRCRGYHTTRPPDIERDSGHQPLPRPRAPLLVRGPGAGDAAIG